MLLLFFAGKGGWSKEEEESIASSQIICIFIMGTVIHTWAFQEKEPAT